MSLLKLIFGITEATESEVGYVIGCVEHNLRCRYYQHFTSLHSHVVLEIEV
jgi:hypothetical protein